MSAHEAACPFCGSARFAPISTRSLVGRLSRAAVFASAAACATSTPTPQQPTTESAAATAIIRGIISSEGVPVPGIRVDLVDSAKRVRSTHTDADGEYMFTELAAGLYEIRTSGAEPRNASVQLGAREVGVRDFDLSPPPEVEEPDRGPCCKPYGAPPARRRVV